MNSAELAEKALSQIDAAEGNFSPPELLERFKRNAGRAMQEIVAQQALFRQLRHSWSEVSRSIRRWDDAVDVDAHLQHRPEQARRKQISVSIERKLAQAINGCNTEFLTARARAAEPVKIVGQQILTDRIQLTL